MVSHCIDCTLTAWCREILCRALCSAPCNALQFGLVVPCRGLHCSLVVPCIAVQWCRVVVPCRGVVCIAFRWWCRAVSCRGGGIFPWIRFLSRELNTHTHPLLSPSLLFLQFHSQNTQPCIFNLNLTSTVWKLHQRKFHNKVNNWTSSGVFCATKN